MVEANSLNKTENELVSVIVPIYNVEKYLNRCVKSIVQQTYKNLEIILVDDGSPDNCPNLCDEWKKQDNRIRVIHKENGGLSDARNAGIKIATGEYFVFVDSDDYIDCEYVRILYRLICEKKVKISICGFTLMKSGGGIVYGKKEAKIEVLTAQKALERMHTHENYTRIVVAWNKMYHKSLFLEHKYPVGRLHEDGFLTHQLIYEAKMVAITSQPLYIYEENPNSITREKYSLKRLDEVDAYEVRNRFFEEKDEKKLLHLSMIWYIQVLQIHYWRVKIYYPEEKEILKRLLKNFRNTLYKAIWWKEIPLKKKSMYLFTAFFPTLYCKIKSRKENEYE